jgi:hypothetical protein
MLDSPDRVRDRSRIPRGRPAVSLAEVELLKVDVILRNAQL